MIAALATILAIAVIGLVISVVIIVIQRKQSRCVVTSMLNKNTLGVKKVRGQSEAALQVGMCDQKL